MSRFKKGNIVKIYHDPITKKELEGEAKLIKKIAEKDDHEIWKVRFTDDWDTGVYTRKIWREEK